MKRIILLVALLLCLSSAAFAATAWNTSTLQRFNVANLPRSPSTGMMFYVLDGSSTSDCTTGGGTNKVVCVFNGSAYVGISGGDVATDTIWNAEGDIAVGSGADTATIISKGSSNTFFGVSSAGTLGFFGNYSLSDSAAQFYNATSNTKYVKIDASLVPAGSTFTLQPFGAHTLTIATTASISVYLPATSITLPSNPIGGTLGATANVIPKSNGTGTATLQASGLVDDGTDIVTTEYFYAGLKGNVIATSTTVTGTNARGATYYMSTSSPLYLPTGAAGMVVAVRTIAATNPIVIPAGSGIISNAGTNYGATSGIRNTSATIGNQITLHNPEGTTWYVWGANGTWTAE